MARPQPKFTSDAMARNEQQDREYVLSLGDCNYPSDIPFDSAYGDLDYLTRAAGLTGGWRALHREMVATSKRLPGYRLLPASASAPSAQSLDVHERMPLLVRAWALEFAVHLIDPDASGPPVVASPWW